MEPRQLVSRLLTKWEIANPIAARRQTQSGLSGQGSWSEGNW
jgi:hypothetical protein